MIQDNILGKIQIEGSSTIARRSHNLLSSDSPSGPGEIRGKPTYVGGASPQSRSGFRLKVGSLGVRKASDGRNIGARISP